MSSSPPDRLRTVPSLPTRTPSLRLRRFVPADAPRLMALNGEPSTRHWLPSHVYSSPEAAEAALRFLVSAYASPGDPRLGPYVLALDDGRSGELLGHVGFSPLQGEVEVSFAIAESARKRGYAVEALLHGCGWIAGAFELPSIVAVTAAGNAASAAPSSAPASPTSATSPCGSKAKRRW